MVARLMGAPAATATIARDHVEVGLLTDEEATVMFAAMEEAAGAAKSSSAFTVCRSQPWKSPHPMPAGLGVLPSTRRLFLGLEGRHGESDEPYSAAATARNTLVFGLLLEATRAPEGMAGWRAILGVDSLNRSSRPGRKRALPGIAPPNAVSTRPGFRVGRP